MSKKAAGVSQLGGEAPVEMDPSRKHLVEGFVPLTESVMWTLLANYYKKMALEAWSHNYVPMFVTSNSKFARDYAKSVLALLIDWYKLPSADPSVPVYILETGGGHGRFSYLFLRHILRTRGTWEACGLPQRPFVYVFSDVTEANVAFCEQHTAMQQFIQDGWLDFSLFDANATADLSRAIHLNKAQAPLPRGAPIVVIANYVLDSLLTDGIRIVSVLGDPSSTVVSRSKLALYSTEPEEDPTDPDVISRMTVAWDWEPFAFPPCQGETETCSAFDRNLLTSMEPTAPEADYLRTLLATRRRPNTPPRNGTQAGVGEGSSSAVPPRSTPQPQQQHGTPMPEYLARNPRIQSVLRYYIQQSVETPGFSTMSFVLPVGAFLLFDYLYAYSDGKLMALIGDKGYKEFDESRGQRNPHIAIHGSISFMVNLHSIKLFFEALGGCFACTPYKDTFQVMLCYAFRSAEARAFAHSICRLIEGYEDFPPDGPIAWQRLLQETAPPKALGLKNILCLLRYSAHDPEVFYNFRHELTSQSVGVLLGSRGESDLQKDLERVYENWYKIRAGEDVPDVLAHLSMKTGRLDRAIFYFERSLETCPESRHPASYVNLAACQKALGRLDEAKETLRIALQEHPTFQPALDLQSQIHMCQFKTRIAFIGCGRWTQQECCPQLLRDPRVECKTAFAFRASDAEAVIETIRLHGNEAFLYKGAAGLEQVLVNPEITACVVDVHPDIFKSVATRVWAAGKHILSATPLATAGSAAHDTVQAYLEARQQSKVPIAWHVVAPYRSEEAFEEAVALIKKGPLGHPINATFRRAVEETRTDNAAATKTAHDPEGLAADVLDGIQGLTMLLDAEVTAMCVRPSDDAGPPSVASWLKLRPFKSRKGGSYTRTDTQSDVVVATAFCSHKVGDSLECFEIEFTQGTLRLTLVHSGWKLLATPPSGPPLADKAFLACNLSNTCDAWFTQILRCQQEKQRAAVEDLTTTTRGSSPDASEQQLALPTPSNTVHCSIAASMGDSSNLGAIFLSLQGKGNTILTAAGQLKS